MQSFSNIILKKTKSDLAHGKLWDTAKLVAMEVNGFAIKIRLTATSTTVNEDNYTGEIFNKVKLLASQFANLSQGKITKIFTKKFRLINLYKLYHIRRCNNIYQDQIFIEDRTLKIKKVMRSYKNYSQDNVLWFQDFHNYIMIFLKLFSTITPFLHFILYHFH